jgi:glycerate kinase
VKRIFHPLQIPRLLRCKSILVASGSFKDVHSPQEACKLIKVAVEATGYGGTVSVAPMADGGEYSMDLLVSEYGAEKIKVHGIIDPNGNEVVSYYIVLDDTTAYIASSTILRLHTNFLETTNPLNLTTYGYGQLISHAINKGFKKIILGMGGTNTVDGGIGMAQALGVVFRDLNGRLLKPSIGQYFSGNDLSKVGAIDVLENSVKYKKVKIMVACDADISVDQMFLPIKQKIGNRFDNKRKKISENLFQSLINYSDVIENHIKLKSYFRSLDCRELNKRKYFGCAGGLILSLYALFDIDVFLGVNFFAETLKLEEKIKSSDLIITGEGRFDNSIHGKTPVGVSRLALKNGKPVIYLVGNVDKSLLIFFDSFISKSLPNIFALNGISTILSCHPFYNSMKVPNSYSEKIDFYRKNNLNLFIDILKKYFIKKEFIDENSFSFSRNGKKIRSNN